MASKEEIKDAITSYLTPTLIALLSFFLQQVYGEAVSMREELRNMKIQAEVNAEKMKRMEQEAEELWRDIEKVRDRIERRSGR